jgi:hypothetical protein
MYRSKAALNLGDMLQCVRAVVTEGLNDFLQVSLTTTASQPNNGASRTNETE